MIKCYICDLRATVGVNMMRFAIRLPPLFHFLILFDMRPFRSVSHPLPVYRLDCLASVCWALLVSKHRLDLELTQDSVDAADVLVRPN